MEQEKGEGFFAAAAKKNLILEQTTKKLGKGRGIFLLGGLQQRGTAVQGRRSSPRKKKN